MTGKRTMTFIVKSYIFFSIVLFISACSSTKLIEIDKTSNFLNLSEEQLKVVQPKIETIKIIVDKYNTEKEKLETELNQSRSSRMGGGGFGGPPPGGSGRGQSGFREEIRQKIQALREKQSKSQGQIDALVADIKAVLNKEQLEKFEKIKLPKLEMPEFGGGQQRGGGRMGGGGGGRPGGGGGSFPPF
jgi:peptidoglycan hydrolase CwlO-like protein